MWRLSHFGTYLFHYLNKQKSYAPYTYQLCWCFIVNYRPNTVNFGYLGLLLKGKEIHLWMSKKEYFFGNPYKNVEKWNLGSCLGLVTVKGRHLSHCMFIGRFCAASAFDGFLNITTHFFLIFYKLKSDDADCWCKLGVRDIRCRADNGHVLCNLGVSRVPFSPKVRVTLKTETGATQNWRKNRNDKDNPKTKGLQQPKK